MLRHVVVTTLLLQTALVAAATYHLDPTGGDDQHNGLTPQTAWKSLATVNRVALQAGDNVLLKRGGVFQGQLVIRNAMGTKEKPVVVDAYGEGAMPIIDAATTPPGVLVMSSNFVEVRNIEVTSDGGTTGTNQPLRSGVHLTTEGKGGFQSVVLSNLYIHDIFNKAPMGGAVGIRIDRSDDSTFQDIRIERCRIERTAFTGIFVKRVNKLRVLDNQLKDIGGPGIVPHQGRDVVLRGNTVNHSGSKVDPRMNGRGSGAWCLGCTDVLVENNQFRHARGILDSCGFHVDIGSKNVVVQYNLSVDNAGGFVQILGRNQNTVYRYNVSVNDGWRVKGVDGAIGNGHVLTTSGFNVAGKPNAVSIGPTNTYIYNNTIYVKNDLRGVFSFGPTTDGLLIANNIFHLLGPTEHQLGNWEKTHAPAGAAIRNVVFANNLYVREAVLPKDMPVRDSRMMIGDAGFVRAGGLEAADYAPTNVALIKDKGIVVQTLPGDTVGLKTSLAVEKDFFGNPIAGLPDLGAVESTSSAMPYLAAVRQFADQVLAHGRDTYGKPTPLFVDGLNVDTREPVKWKWGDGKEWVLCNLSSQQGLLRTLDGLSGLTGEPRYKEAALEALRYAFDHLRYGTEHNGGLLAWGGHLAYNATDDVIAGHPEGAGRIHELKCFFPHYELMWEANPQATRQLIENMWEGHVLDWARLDFNRHANPKKRGLLWQNEYRGGPVFFDGQGLTFHNAGSDFYFAAGMLSQIAGTGEPLVWAKRLCHRYVETRDPTTGLGGFQFSQSQSAWCDDVGKIRGDRAQYQYGADFPGHRVVEGTLFPCYGDTPEVQPQVGRLLLGEQLGEAGRDFTRWAVEELTAWGKSAYRKKDNAFVPMLTDGTSMEGYVCKKDGYFGPKGRVLRAGHPGGAHLWLYAWAFRLSRDAFLWEMARNIAQGNHWGDIGETPQAGSSLRFSNNPADPFLLMALLELHRVTGSAAFLEQAQAIGQNILKQRVYQGWFVPSQQHLFCHLSNNEAQALLHLGAALLGKPQSLPAFTGASGFFHAAYGGQALRSYDSATIYKKVRP